MGPITKEISHSNIAVKRNKFILKPRLLLRHNFSQIVIPPVEDSLLLNLYPQYQNPPYNNDDAIRKTIQDSYIQGKMQGSDLNRTSFKPIELEAVDVDTASITTTGCCSRRSNPALIRPTARCVETTYLPNVSSPESGCTAVYHSVTGTRDIERIQTSTDRYFVTTPQCERVGSFDNEVLIPPILSNSHDRIDYRKEVKIPESILVPEDI